jgi:hypothetical protein
MVHKHDDSSVRRRASASSSATTNESLLVHLSDDNGTLKPLHKLLYNYYNESAALYDGFAIAEQHYRNLHFYFQLFIVISTIVSASLAGIPDIPFAKMFILGLNMFSLIAAGAEKVINIEPLLQGCRDTKTEFGAMKDNIFQFLMEAEHSDDELRSYSQQTANTIDIWKALAPSIPTRFIVKRRHVRRTRRYVAHRRPIEDASNHSFVRSNTMNSHRHVPPPPHASPSPAMLSAPPISTSPQQTDDNARRTISRNDQKQT